MQPLNHESPDTEDPTPTPAGCAMNLAMATATRTLFLLATFTLFRRVLDLNTYLTSPNH
jgi:hypothetical protein